jgi:hypothetical protein
MAHTKGKARHVPPNTHGLIPSALENQGMHRTARPGRWDSLTLGTAARSAARGSEEAQCCVAGVGEGQGCIRREGTSKAVQCCIRVCRGGEGYAMRKCELWSKHRLLQEPLAASVDWLGTVLSPLHNAPR